MGIADAEKELPPTHRLYETADSSLSTANRASSSSQRFRYRMTSTSDHVLGFDSHLFLISAVIACRTRRTSESLLAMMLSPLPPSPRVRTRPSPANRQN